MVVSIDTLDISVWSAVLCVVTRVA